MFFHFHEVQDPLWCQCSLSSAIPGEAMVSPGKWFPEWFPVLWPICRPNCDTKSWKAKVSVLYCYTCEGHYFAQALRSALHVCGTVLIIVLDCLVQLNVQGTPSGDQFYTCNDHEVPGYHAHLRKPDSIDNMLLPLDAQKLPFLHYFACPWLWNHKVRLLSTKLSKPKGFTMFHHVSSHPLTLQFLSLSFPVHAGHDARWWCPVGWLWLWWALVLALRTWATAELVPSSMFQALQVRAGEGLVWIILICFKLIQYDSIHVRKAGTCLHSRFSWSLISPIFVMFILGNILRHGQEWMYWYAYSI